MNNLNSKIFNCTGCGLCSNICPTNAIKIEHDEEGFYQFNIDEKKCIDCGLCVKKCPKINFKNKNNKEEINVYAAYSKNKEIVSSSTSGGTFSELALQIIKENGIVIGVSYENNKVKHIVINNEKELEKLKGSKYIQSFTGNIYNIVKENLKQNKKVLFSGTPCQCAAMRNMINNDDNLIIVDIVCHGVPSYKVFQKANKDRFNKEITKVQFRNKKNGWSNFNIRYYNKNRIIKTNMHRHDDYFAGYLKNYYLMKSCYNCEFANIPRVSDITLGDFWGIETINKDFFKNNNDQGVSLVCINNKKGQKLFDKIKENIFCSKESLESSYKYNPRINNGNYDEKMLENRKIFFEHDFNTSFKIRRYSPSLKEKIIYRIKRPLVKIKKIIKKAGDL